MTELFAQKRRLRGAAFRAKQVYPGAVGELLAREFSAFAELDFAIGQDGLTLRAAEELLTGGERVLAPTVSEDQGVSGSTAASGVPGS